MSKTIRSFAYGAIAASMSLGAIAAEDASNTDQEKIDGIQWSLPAGPMYDPDFDFALAALPTALHQFDAGSRPSFTKLTTVYGSNGNWNLGFETDYYLMNDNVHFMNYLGYTDAIFTQYDSESLSMKEFGTVSITDFGNLSYQVIDNLYMGVGWSLASTELDRSPGAPSFISFATDDTKTSYGLYLNYNTRDSNFYPTRGVYVTTELQKTYLDKEKAANEPRNGEFDYETLKIDARYYYPLTEQTTLAVRGGLVYNTDDAPMDVTVINDVVKDFQGLSREVLARSAVSGEAYVRHWFNDRWGMSAGLVAARGIDTNQAYQDKNYYAGVFGIRYMLIPESNLSLRIDLSQNTQDEEGTLLYFRVGEVF